MQCCCGAGKQVFVSVSHARERVQRRWFFAEEEEGSNEDPFLFLPIYYYYHDEFIGDGGADWLTSSLRVSSDLPSDCLSRCLNARTGEGDTDSMAMTDIVVFLSNGWLWFVDWTSAAGLRSVSL